MLKLHLEELAVGVVLMLVHLLVYYHLSQTPVPVPPKAMPILLEFIEPPKPKPVPLPEPKIIPPKLVLDKPPEPKIVKTPPKKVVVKPQPPKRVVEVAKLQQQSKVQVQADEIVEKAVVERPQQLTETVVKKPDKPSEEKVEVKAVEKVVEHEPVMTKASYGGCRSALNRYPNAAHEQELEGTVKIKVHVLADGSVSHASIVKSSGEDLLDDGALENVRDCVLEPAQKDGVAIESDVTIPIRFTLD